MDVTNVRMDILRKITRSLARLASNSVIARYVRIFTAAVLVNMDIITKIQKGHIGEAASYVIPRVSNLVLVLILAESCFET